MRCWLTLGCLVLAICPLRAADTEKSVEDLAADARKSVVVITVTERDGKRTGVGTGFFVSADGLIATNLHVIGESRPIRIETADGRRLTVTHVHATDRTSDLAVLRVEGKDHPPLPLGGAGQLKDGQSVVALGNPQGLRHSVVAGVVSGFREIDGRDMIQLAIPIEPGNSGGPLLDRRGRVQGVNTLKSAVTDNLGFAVGIEALRPLLEKPNPVPMEKWLTIGALDPEEWEVVGGASWRRRAGRLVVEGAGGGFGGRSLCLAKAAPPEGVYEVGVTVRLADEAGAAGLVFASDGGDKHFGFYASGGQLRLTRFDGPDVLTWKILEQRPSPHYRSGDWNALKVRIEKGRIRCFVNDRLLCEHEADLPAGRVGLCKFRDTKAEFRSFAVGKEVGPTAPPAAVAERVTKAAAGLDPTGSPPAEVVERLAKEGAAGDVLAARARRLEEEAAGLRALAAAVRHKQALSELADAVQVPDAEVDLARAALLIARLDNPEVDVAAYRKEVDRLAAGAARGLAKDADDAAKLKRLNEFLFAERGFHGSRGDYYNRSNSYLNEVLDDREGLPITLSVLYLEVGRRLGLRLEGVALPGHFVVRHRPAKGEPALIDVFDGGAVLTREAAEKKAGVPLTDDALTAVPKVAVIKRMLHNLLNLARADRDIEGALRYLDAIVAVDPKETGPERWMRAVIRAETGKRDGVRADLEWLLENRPDGVDPERVESLLRRVAREQ
jgi:regulator of sirC expression with transglutaminase-like and TPR domain